MGWFLEHFAHIVPVVLIPAAVLVVDGVRWRRSEISGVVTHPRSETLGQQNARLVAQFNADLGNRRRHRLTPAHTPTRSVNDALVTTAGLCSLGAGVTHVFLAHPHGEGRWFLASSFVSLGLFQLTWGWFLLRHATQPTLLFGALFNVLIVVTWGVSRLVPLPLLSVGGEAEPARISDVAATTLEVLVVLTTTVLLAGVFDKARIRERVSNLVVVGAALFTVAATQTALLTHAHP